MGFGKSKGQVATEYLILTGTLLLIIAVSATYALTIYNSTISNFHMNDSINEIKEATNYVAALGPGNSLVVEIELPDGVIAGRAENNFIDYNARINNTFEEFLVLVDANISPGTLPTQWGKHWLNISMVGNSIIIQEI